MRRFLIALFLLSGMISQAQQYPWWTQYRSNSYMLNPGFCGTSRLMDLRLSYRNQWTGIDDAPKTYALSVNSRYMKGKLGTGLFMFRDVIGPFQTTNLSATVAYHLKFPDSELSFGLQGNYLRQKLIGTDITLRNQQDKAINQYVTNTAGNFDGSLGVVYYNDRFHVGISANNVIGSQINFYEDDSLKTGKYTNVPHYTLSMGYNWANSPDMVFQNSLMVVHTAGTPLLLDYTLRMHFYQKLYAGFSFRLKDAIALQVGYTLNEELQLGYSYDIVTNPLSRYQSGSHEIKFIYSTNFGTDKKKRGLDKRFLRQKFQYLL